ncbi:methyltransferase [Paenibacillus mucilaginosus KNP414]|uniref:Methyltransferase n=1 Tax=Paenibacillus mucilaginosus (strain KNP414) TaxID=1036673 RepID=F8FDA4_PAEMK|nr:methyltransferase [Paenibacillus mucilaginosus KNP414]
MELKGALHYRFSSFCCPKVLHENAEPAKAEEKLGVMLAEQFRQGLLQPGEADYQVLVSKKGLVLSQESWEVEGQQLLELGGSHITQVGEREGCVFLFITPSDVQFSLDDEVR